MDYSVEELSRKLELGGESVDGLRLSQPKCKNFSNALKKFLEEHQGLKKRMEKLKKQPPIGSG